MCYNCFKNDQFNSKCRSKNSYFKYKCSKKRQSVLHDYFIQREKTRYLSKQNKENKKNNQKTETLNQQSILATCSTDNVNSEIIPMKIQANKGQMVSTYMLLDSGSQSTLIREDSANQLQLKDAKTKISISALKLKRDSINMKKVALEILDINRDNELDKQQVFTITKNMFGMS